MIPRSIDDPLIDVRTLFQMPNTDSDTPAGVSTDQSLLDDVRAPLQVCSTGKVLDEEPFACEQRKDPDVKEIVDFVACGVRPVDSTRAI